MYLNITMKTSYTSARFCEILRVKMNNHHRKRSKLITSREHQMIRSFTEIMISIDSWMCTEKGERDPIEAKHC